MEELEQAARALAILSQIAPAGVLSHAVKTLVNAIEKAVIDKTITKVTSPVL